MKRFIKELERLYGTGLIYTLKILPVFKEGGLLTDEEKRKANILERRTPITLTVE